MPNQGATTSSSSIHRGGPQIRAAAAEARQALLALRLDAARRADRQPRRVQRAWCRSTAIPSRSVSYGALLGDKPFNVKFTGTAPQKPINRYKLVGTRVPRVDIPDKMSGKIRATCSRCACPTCCTAASCGRAGKRAYGDGAKPLSIDESSIAGIPGARIVRKGDFVGVVAEREWDAVKAARALKVTWQESATLPGNADLFDAHARRQDHRHGDRGLGRCRPRPSPAPRMSRPRPIAARTSRTPRSPPNCALADVGPNGALVMSSTQDIYNSRDMLAAVLGLPVDKVRVQYYEGSGTFGRSCYEDAAQAAAVMSQAVGKPVRVQFMRSDELGWDDYGPAHLADVRAGIDANGKLVAYEYHGWQHGWMVNETTHELALQTPPKERTTGAGSIPVNRMSTGSMYAVANRRVVSHAVPMVGYLKGAPLRSPLDLSFAFASEQTIDELAFMRQDRSARIPPQQHRRRTLARRAQRRRRSRGVEAAGRGLGVVRRRGRDRPRHRARHPPRLVWRRGGRDRGQPPHRQHRGHADLRRARCGPGRSIPRWSRTRSSGR